MQEWTYQNKPLDEEILSEYVAFVYCITNLKDGRKYYGKKRLQFTRHKKVKGRKNRKRVVTTSDFKTYWGSSKELLVDIDTLGKENFKREIILLCKTLTESSYWELWYQMDNHVLLNPDKYYNSFVGGRINRKQLSIK